MNGRIIACIYGCMFLYSSAFADMKATIDSLLARDSSNIRSLYQRGVYTIDIKQETPTKGIKSGYIIAYGHIIKAPYRLYTKHSVLYVNNVQLDPQLVLDRERKTLIQNNSIEAITNNTYTLFYQTLNETRNNKYAIEKAADYFTINNPIDTIVRINEHSFTRIAHDVSGRYEKQMIFNDTKTVILPESEHPNDDIEKLRKISLALKMGLLVAVSSVEGICYYRGENIFEIKKVLTRTDITDDDKLRLLNKYIYGVVLLDNYNPKEWEFVK
jgi:hypothetical protein